jgi:hypothetical protein
VGYRYYDAIGRAVDFPFGYGLSYTTFACGGLTVTAHDLSDPIAFDANVGVSSTGRARGHRGRPDLRPRPRRHPAGSGARAAGFRQGPPRGGPACECVARVPRSPRGPGGRRPNPGRHQSRVGRARRCHLPGCARPTQARFGSGVMTIGIATKLSDELSAPLPAVRTAPRSQRSVRWSSRDSLVAPLSRAVAHSRPVWLHPVEAAYRTPPTRRRTGARSS